MKQKTEAQAIMIAERLHDPEGKWCYFKYIRKLGFDKCFELASIAIDASRRGLIKTTPARYFNGCAKKELRENPKISTIRRSYE